MLPNGAHVCDRCGVDVGNGGITECTIVSGLDDDGGVRILHFCLDRMEGDDARTVRGCSRKLLSPATIKNYTERMEAARG